MPRKRNYPITIWLNEKELILLKDKISKTPYLRSDYIRRCSLGKNITVIPGIRDLIIEFKKIGSNLDKISRSMDNDSGNQIILSGDLKSIKEDLKKAWVKLAVIMRKI
jgi:translation initiation factor 1 (eIF-1/SUI1)